MKYVKLGLAAVAAALVLTACSAGGTESEVPPTTGRTATYQILTGWTTVPSDSDIVTDVMVRTIKIENNCYVQSASVYDWSYTLTPAVCQS